MSRKNKLLLFLFFVIIIFSLLTALLPTSDVDNDGYLDSLVTEGFLLVPALCAITGFLSLLRRLPSTCIPVSKLFLTLLVPPPIQTL